MSVSSFFNKRVDIERLDRTADNYMTWTEAAVKVHRNLACCIQPRRGFERVVLAKEQSEVTHVMYCGVVDIQPEWRVNDGGKYYDILDVRDPDLLDRYLIVDMREVIA